LPLQLDDGVLTLLKQAISSVEKRPDPETEPGRALPTVLLASQEVMGRLLQLAEEGVGKLKLRGRYSVESSSSPQSILGSAGADADPLMPMRFAIFG
jgi:hypothetical protein